MMRNKTIKDKPLPPYGQRLQAYLQQGLIPKNSIFLFLGLQAWQKAKAFNNTQVVLLLPPNHSPYNYQWPVQKCSVLAFDTGGLAPNTIEQTAHALLLAGALSVHMVLFDYRLIIYRRD